MPPKRTRTATLATVYRASAKRRRVIRGRRRYPALAKWRGRRLPPLNFYPKSKMVRLRYVTQVSLNPDNTGTPDVKYFLANGMYDPDVQIGGHQPRGFDQAMLGYEHFTVVGSKFTAQLVPAVSAQVGDSQTPFCWGVATLPTNSLGVLTTVPQLLESRLGGLSYRLAGVNNAYGQSRNQVIVRKFSAKKFFTKKNIIGDAGYIGTTAADPSEKAYFALWGASPVTGVDPDGQNFLLTIEYIAVLTEPKILTSS